jgi:hypothetical protein
MCPLRVDRPPVCPTPAMSGRSERVRASHLLDDVVKQRASALAR